MAKYEFYGQKYDFPDDMSDEEALSIMEQDRAASQGNRGAGKPASPTPTRRQPGKKIDPKSLVHDQDFINSVAYVYQAEKLKPFEGTKEELVDYGLQQMSDFNNNLGSLGFDAARLRSATPEYKKAFLYMMDTYDNTEWDWAGAGRIAESLATDPTTYLGLGTFGMGFLGKKGAQKASKEGVKAILKEGIKRGAVTGAIEGAVYTATGDGMRQSAEISLGTRDEFSYGQVAASGAIGAAVGGVAGGLVGVVDGALANRAARTAESRLGGQSADIAPPASLGEEVPTLDMAPNALPASQGVDMPTQVGQGGIDPTLTPEPSVGVLDAPVNSGIPEPTPSSMAPNATPEGAMAPDGTVAPDANTGVLDAPTATPDVFADATSIIKAIEEVSTNAGARIFHTTKDGMAKAAEGAARLIRSLGVGSVDDVAEILRRYEFTIEQRQNLTNAVSTAATNLAKQVRDAVKAGDVAPEQLDEVLKVQEVVTNLDSVLSSPLGRDLGARAGSFNTGERRSANTLPDILSEMGYTNPKSAPPEARAEALQRLADQVDKWEKKLTTDAEVNSLKSKITNAFNRGDIPGAVKAALEKKALENVIKAEDQAAEGWTKKQISRFRYITELLNEWIISNVFTPATITRNSLPALAKAIYLPPLKAATKGFGTAARKEMYASYKAMLSMQGTAFKAAQAAFKYEKVLLTGDETTLMEFAPKIGDIKIPGMQGSIPFGRAVRVFNKALAATDEYFAQIHYRAFVEGNATYEAMLEGQRLGLKGDALKDLVANRVKEAVGNAYEKELDKIGTIDFLTEQGVRRGYSGETLERWVKTELARNEELFKKAKGQTGMDYAKDVLFKREFSGDSAVSKAAKAYENAVNNYPILRLMGQLFFRTPVRVFEEGMRLTPGVNLITPNFVADLKGDRGPIKQVRAQGEAMMGFAIGGAVMTAFANGTITGAGPSDPKARKNWENAGNRPYGIKLSDGSWFSYRNYDPIATPIKIIVNAMERYQMVQLREAQGEYVDQEFTQIAAYAGVGIGAIGQSIRDANLTEGVSEIWDLGTMLLDPDETTSASVVKFAGEKLKLLVPNTAQKIIAMDAPEMPNPATLPQYFDAVINPDRATVPKQYDLLGNVRERPTSIMSMFGIDHYGPEDIGSAQNEKQKVVLAVLSDIETAVGARLTAPYKVEEVYGNTDLRKVKTQDGKTTLYDRWHEYIANDPGMTDYLYEVITNGGSVGTPDKDGVLTMTIRDAINMHRKAALQRLKMDEAGVRQNQFDRMDEDTKALFGIRDTPFLPY